MQLKHWFFANIFDCISRNWINQIEYSKSLSQPLKAKQITPTLCKYDGVKESLHHIVIAKQVKHVRIKEWKGYNHAFMQ